MMYAKNSWNANLRGQGHNGQSFGELYNIKYGIMKNNMNRIHGIESSWLVPNSVVQSYR